MTTEMIQRMFFIIILFVIVIGCSRFDREEFFHRVFGKDIEKLSERKEFQYKDGLLEIDDVSQNDIIYRSFFNQEDDFTISENVVVESVQRKYQATSDQKIYYLVLGQLNEYMKVVLYIPKKSKMVFVYSTLIM